MNEPRNIFEQIMFALKSINDNVVALSENLSVVNQKIDALNFGPVDISEPNTSGEDTATEE